MFTLGFRVTLANRLLLAMAGVSFFMAVGVGLVGYSTGAEALLTSEKFRLQSILEGREAELEAYLGSIRQDLNIVAGNPTTKQALRDFTSAWRQLDDDPTTLLQRLYIDENPYPTGQKELLDAADDQSIYSKMHARYHQWFRELMRERGYYDVFLFDSEGNLVYTVFKERDYATNLLRDRWHETDLGNAFRAARASPGDNSHSFFDFQPYGPSHDAPASFISTAVLDELGQFIGVLAFQMPVDRLNAVLQEASGLGDTGETFIVGADYLRRSDSRFLEESLILKQKVETSAVERALSGTIGIAEAIGTTGEASIAAYRPLDFAGTRWALIAEMSAAEFHGAIDALSVKLLRISLLFIGLCAIAGTLVSRTITRPLVAMTATVADLISGKSERVPDSERREEIGLLARAFQEYHTQNRKLTEELRQHQASLEQKIEQRTKELQDQGWVKSNVLEITTDLQQADDLDEMATTFLSRLLPLIRCQIGAVYLVKEPDAQASGDTRPILSIAATYGCSSSENTPKQFAFGEGLVGQVATDKQPMYLDDVPERLPPRRFCER